MSTPHRCEHCDHGQTGPNELVGQIRFNLAARPQATLAQQEAWLHQEAVGLEQDMRDELRRRRGAR